MKNIYLAYFLIIMLSACGGKSSDTVSLSGEIKGLGNDTLYIYGADEMYDRMDTLPVENGKFSKTLSPDTLVAAWLLFSDGSRYPFFMDKGDKIHIKGSAAELNSMEITGNPHNEELTAFRKELKGLGKPSEKVLEEKAGKFINEHHSSLASIYLLDKYFAQKEKPDYTLIKQLTEHMTGELKDRPYIDGLLDRIQEEEKAATGKTAAYFRLPNAELQRPIPANTLLGFLGYREPRQQCCLPQNLQERTKEQEIRAFRNFFRPQQRQLEKGYRNRYPEMGASMRPFRLGDRSCKATCHKNPACQCTAQPFRKD